MTVSGAFGKAALGAFTLTLIGACTPASDAPTAPASETAAARHPVSGLTLIPVEIESGGKIHRITAEYASTQADLSKGLMFRTELGPDEGMVFDFRQTRGGPAPLSFWMKNTVIPLDIVFIGADGRVLNVAANAVPYSTDPIPSAGPGIAVIELAGGRAAELGIAPGDKVHFTAPAA